MTPEQTERLIAVAPALMCLCGKIPHSCDMCRKLILDGWRWQSLAQLPLPKIKMSHS